MTYDWVCKKHDEPHFQYTIQSMLTVIVIPPCDLCGSPMSRVFNAVPTHFRGGGWGKD